MADLQELFERELAEGGFARLPPEQALHACVDTVSRIMGTDVASLYGFDAERQELTLVATHGLAPSAVGFVSLRLGEGVTGRAGATRAPYSVADVSRDAHFKLIPGFDQSAFPSILAVPVLFEGDLVGALNVQSAEVHHHSPEEVAGLCGIARLLGPVLAHWQRDGDAVRHLRGPRLLSYVDGMAAAALTPVAQCQRFVDDLSTVLAHVDCGVLLHGTAAAAGWIGSELVGDDVVRITLRGPSRECGVLAMRSRTPGSTPWNSPPAWQYVRSLAEQFGVALERALDVEDARGDAGDADLYDSLLSHVMDDRGLDSLVADISSRVDGTVAVVDQFGTVLAGSEGALAGSEGAEGDRVLRPHPIKAGDQELAHLMIAPATVPPHLVETFCQVIALELVKWRVGLEVEARMRGDLLELMLGAGEANVREVTSRASLAGLDIRRDYTPVMFAFDSTPALEPGSAALRSMLQLVQRRLGQPPGSLVFTRHNGLLALVHPQVPGAAGAAATRQLAEGTREELLRVSRMRGIGLGIGSPTVWPKDFRRAVHGTVRAAEFALRTRCESSISVDRLGSYGLLVALEDEALREYVRGQLGALLDQDERSGGDLVATLEAYHVAADRLKPAADALYIHVNTLKYRLARIEALTGSALSDPMRKHDLYLALHALHIIEPGRKGVLGDNLLGS